MKADRPVEPTRAYTSRELFGRFWRDYLRPHIPLLALAFVVMLIEGSTLGMLSYMLEPLFDQVFQPGGSGGLIWVGGAILALFVVRAATSIIGRRLTSQVNLQSAGDMQTTLVRHMLTLDTSFFQTNPPGSLIERVQGDTLASTTATIMVFSGVSRDLVSLIGLFVVALMIDPLWTAAALIGAPLLLLPTFFVRRYLYRKVILSREQAGLRATRLDEIFHGIQAVKLNRMETYQSHRFQRIIETIVRAEVKAATARAAMPALVDVITGIGFFAVLMLGGSEVAEGKRTVGEFMSFFTAMALTFQPIRRLSDLAGLWQVGRGSLVRIFSIFDTESKSTRPAQSRSKPAPGAPEIRFEAVTFGYPDRPVLNGLTFTAEAGKVTALVGRSGAGKSTVFQLIAALVEPQSGRILIGGVDVRDLSLSDQRILLATVLQDSALFDETLHENLILGRTGLEPARIEKALADAEVASFVAALPLGLETPAGTRGSALSGGQRQRIAIARALLADAPVLLLDEATSALVSMPSCTRHNCVTDPFAPSLAGLASVA
ncbi:MAG: ABC transporter ATP-binding protein [Rhodobacterales bacterium 32-66-9]|nr:MAG: ABC transporter ATP-binding protein [Rhodobacterales bacterium 32-66-9]